MLLTLVELRSSDWGRVSAAAASSNATPDNDPNYFMVGIHPRLVLVLIQHLPVCLCFYSNFSFPRSEWTYVLHRRRYSVYSSGPWWVCGKTPRETAATTLFTYWHQLRGSASPFKCLSFSGKHLLSSSYQLLCRQLHSLVLDTEIWFC